MLKTRMTMQMQMRMQMESQMTMEMIHRMAYYPRSPDDQVMSEHCMSMAQEHTMIATQMLEDIPEHHRTMTSMSRARPSLIALQ
jgi:hypothetical protein